MVGLGEGACEDAYRPKASTIAARSKDLRSREEDRLIVYTDGRRARLYLREAFILEDRRCGRWGRPGGAMGGDRGEGGGRCEGGEEGEDDLHDE